MGLRVAVPWSIYAVPCREPMPLTYARFYIGLVLTKGSIKKPFGGSGNLFVFVLLLLWLPCLSFLMSYLCMIETNGTGFLGFMRVLAWFNKRLHPDIALQNMH